jgi:5'-deoxynucleotidase YfbR-like HD superfamily hydrolase
MDHSLEEEIRRISNVIESGEVQRFHAVPSVPMQSVAQHAWGVSVLCTFIKTDPRPDMIMFALCHDMEELYTGDIPFTTKREVTGLNELLEKAEDACRKEHLFDLPRITKAEKAVIKFADMLEGLRWTMIYERGDKVVCHRWRAAIWDMMHHEETLLALSDAEMQRVKALFETYLPTIQ